jgi:hypothetical protein
VDPKEIGWGRVEWIDLAHDGYKGWAVVNVLMNLLVP